MNQNNKVIGLHPDEATEILSN